MIAAPAPGSLIWFARHEIALTWRDWTALMTGGKRMRTYVAVAVFASIALVAHLIAYSLLGPHIANGIVADKTSLVWLTGAGILFFTVMLSQAMESVTRAYYARADLDLILSSPASSRRLFAIRTLSIAGSTMMLSCLLAGPAINILAYHDSPVWLLAYGVMAVLAAIATAIAVGITIALFRLTGPKRTRFIAQILAAIVGAGFLIGIQLVAILAFGQYARFSFLQSDAVLAAAPAADSLFWLPARAAMGDGLAFAMLAIAGFGLLGLVIAASSASFGHYAVAAAGVPETRFRAQGKSRLFRHISQKQVLRRKEWKLLARDPWLLSQTLMQILYLLPPALLLWLNYGQDAGMFIVVVPVLVMASGQLAGGLAWLAISGEDAHDLVVTAPVNPRTILAAKIEAVLGAIAMVLTPLLLLMALSSWQAALVTGFGALLSAGSATLIQLWFRSQAKRAMFRRRQVSSRVATLSEAFASIMWAGTAAIAVSGAWLLAIIPAVIALIVMGIAKALSPRASD
ncbi:permease [Mariluticola halotolerans]|uniref:permease n=1 Tax=Mariluticola halotolerans TaxID=2909283 RepID=UPI0026E1F379|nr:permease [Mariluticola halotolerans]UJQ93017.1 permease [Mariluticola halotolerans]